MPFPLTETTPCLPAEKRKEAVTPPKAPYEVKRDLLVEYPSTLQRLKIAQWEHKEILAAKSDDEWLIRKKI